MCDLTNSVVQDCNFTTVSPDRHARSCERVHRAQARSQFYHSFLRSTRTILRKGCTQHHKIAILTQFHAIGMYDLTNSVVQDCNFTTVSPDRHARSDERVHRAQARSQFYHSFLRSTRTILRKGCTQHHKIAILTQFHAIGRHVRSYEFGCTRLQFYHSLARSTRTILRKGCISASFFRTMAPPPLLLKQSIK